MVQIATIRNDYTSKFGVPRQSGLVNGLESRIVFEKPFRNADALRGLDGFTHLWLLWDFNLAHSDGWSPTVRPPRLGGNKRIGVWATRSPFRPNNIGLSCVKLVRIELDTPNGPVLVVEGADLMDGTPILDIKPYLPFTDAHSEASSGWTEDTKELNPELQVKWESGSAERLKLTEVQMVALTEILKSDPRPHYKEDGERIYRFEFAGQKISFRVADGVATVL